MMDSRITDFEYDGEMSADVALNADLRELYPFSRLSGPANVLIMPALHSANISSKLLQELGGGTVIGPILVGLTKAVQIVARQKNGREEGQAKVPTKSSTSKKSASTGPSTSPTTIATTSQKKEKMKGMKKGGVKDSRRKH